MLTDRISERLRLGNIASERDPRCSPWGYFGCDYFPGVGLFFWFDTKEQLLEYLSEYEGADSESHDLEFLRAEMRKITDDIRAGRLDFEVARQQFNAVLKDHLDIEWMGHFDEMQSGKHPFCNQIREEFLEESMETDDESIGMDDESTAPAIAPEQVEDFIIMLHNYGH